MATNYNAPIPGYDYTADPMYRGGTQQTRQAMDIQNASNVNRTNIGNELDQWKAGRDPYYQALQKSFTTAAQPGLQQQYADAMKSTTLGAAQRGLRGGSQEQYQQASNYGAYQSDLGQADIAGQLAANQQRLADSEHVVNWKTALEGMQSGDAAQYNAIMQRIQQQQQATAAGQGAQMENMQMGQNLANQRSQMWGGVLGTLGSGVRNLGPMALMGGG